MTTDIMIVSSQAIEIVYVNGLNLMVKNKVTRQDLMGLLQNILVKSDCNIAYNEFEVTREFLWDCYPDEVYPNNLKGLLDDWEEYYYKED